MCRAVLHEAVLSTTVEVLCPPLIVSPRLPDELEGNLVGVAPIDPRPNVAQTKERHRVRRGLLKLSYREVFVSVLHAHVMELILCELDQEVLVAVVITVAHLHD